MKDHDFIDKRSYEFAVKIIKKIENDPEKKGLKKAKITARRWYVMHKNSFFKEWINILNKPWPEIKRIYLDKSDNGKRLRQNSPFCGILTNKERLSIIKRFINYEKKAS